MFSRRLHLGLAVTAALLLSGCDTINDTADSIWSSLSGGDSNTSSTSAQKGGTGGSTVVAIPPSPAESNPQPTLGAARQPPALGTGNFAAPAVTPGSPTGTYVGAQVQVLRGDLQRLQDNINRHNAELQQLRQAMAQDASTYYGLVGTINSRLQVGTTPGNPELLAQWNQAQAALDRMSDDIAKLNSLSNQAASDSSLAAYTLEAAKAAYRLQGAVEEDHRQLNQIEIDVNRSVVLIDRLLNSIADDISRQNNYVSNERSNLVTLSLAIKDGELYGQSLSNRSFAAAAPSAPPQRSSSIAERRPLVVIRFDRPNVAYEQALYSAVSRALAVPYHVDLLPPEGTGTRYYYIATLQIESLSESELEEVERWLKGEVGPAISHTGNIGDALAEGFRRLLIRFSGLPRRTLEARSGIFQAGR
jgi:hypothetical protein